MSGVVTAAVVVGAAGVYSANKAADAAGGAADTMAQAEQNKLNYLVEQDADPQYYREKALGQIGSYYGIDQTSKFKDDHLAAQRNLEDLLSQEQHWKDRGGQKGRAGINSLKMPIDDARLALSRTLADYESSKDQGGGGQQGIIDEVQQSPFYKQNIQAGEQAIGRGLSMTGGLRSGTANEGLAKNSQSVLQGLVNQRLQGLQTMAQLPSNANNIGQSMSNVGSIQGQGKVAGAQARQQGYQNAATGVGGAVGSYLGRPQTRQSPPPAPATGNVFNPTATFNAYAP